MGRIAETHRFQIAQILSGLVFLVVTTTGCSTASWVVNHKSSSDSLIITEADVDEMIDKLSMARVEDTGGILYNKVTDRYELTPDIFRKAMRDGIIRKIQDRKISTFLEEYHQESFTDALRKDMGTTGAVILLLGIFGALFY